MAVMGITFFLRYEKWGWTYNLTKTFPDDDPGQYSPSADFLTALSGCHSNYVVIERYRVSNLELPRLNKPVAMNDRFGTAGSTIALPNYSIQYQLLGSGGKRRLIQFRGGLQTWPAIDAATGQGNPPGTALTAYNFLKSVIVTDGYEIRVLKSELINPSRGISSIRQSSGQPGYLAFTTSPDGAWVEENKVIIGKVDPLLFPALNGTWPITDKTGTTYTIPYVWRQGADEVFYPTTGYARKAEYSQSIITAGNFYKVSSRDTGRPFGLSHGRTKGVSARP